VVNSGKLTPGVDSVAPESVVSNNCVDGPKESGIFLSCEGVDGCVTSPADWDGDDPNMSKYWEVEQDTPQQVLDIQGHLKQCMLAILDGGFTSPTPCSRVDKAWLPTTAQT